MHSSGLFRERGAESFHQWTDDPSGHLFGDEADQDCSRDCSFPDAQQRSLTQQTKHTGDQDQRAVKPDFYRREREREGTADRQTKPFASQRDNICVDLTADADSDQQDSQQTANPAQEIIIRSQELNGGECSVGEPAEQQRDRELQKLNRAVFSSEQQDLQQNQGAVHRDGGSADGQREQAAEGIRQAGDRRGTQSGLDGQ